MIVEFTGASGSGKSTVARLARLSLVDQGRAVATLNELIASYIDSRWLIGRAFQLLPGRLRAPLGWYAYRFYYSKVMLEEFGARHPDSWASYRGRLEGIRKQNPGDYRFVSGWAESVMSQYALVRRMLPDASVFFWEEGIAHRVVNLFVNTSESVDAVRLREFLASWPLPDVLVEVRAQTSTCLRRMSQRGLSPRLRGKGTREIELFLERSALAVREVVGEARKRGVPVLTLDNDHETQNQLIESPTWLGLLERLEDLVRLALHDSVPLGGPRAGLTPRHEER